LHCTWHSIAGRCWGSCPRHQRVEDSPLHPSMSLLPRSSCPGVGHTCQSALHSCEGLSGSRSEPPTRDTQTPTWWCPNCSRQTCRSAPSMCGSSSTRSDWRHNYVVKIHIFYQ
jgi:hypothetical protein